MHQANRIRERWKSGGCEFVGITIKYFQWLTSMGGSFDFNCARANTKLREQIIRPPQGWRSWRSARRNGTEPMLKVGKNRDAKLLRLILLKTRERALECLFVCWHFLPDYFTNGKMENGVAGNSEVSMFGCGQADTVLAFVRKPWECASSYRRWTCNLETICWQCPLTE